MAPRRPSRNCGQQLWRGDATSIVVVVNPHQTLLAYFSELPVNSVRSIPRRCQDLRKHAFPIDVACTWVMGVRFQLAGRVYQETKADGKNE